jgi:hypothetical protein
MMASLSSLLMVEKKAREFLQGGLNSIALECPGEFRSLERAGAFDYCKRSAHKDLDVEPGSP